jgi:hypothetical protein
MAFAALVLGACMVAAAYALSLTGVGFATASLLNRMGVGGGPPSRVDVSTAFSLGVGLYGSIWILLGVLGLLTLIPVLAFLSGGLLFGAWAVWLRLSGNGKELPLKVDRGKLERSLAAAVVVLLAILAISSLRPPFGDPIAFYLAWPKVIAASGLISPLPDYEHISRIWMTSEAHFAALLLLGGESAAKFFIWINLLAAVNAACLLAAECGCGRRGRILAAIMVITSTAVINVTVDGKTDMVAVTPALCAVLWALRLGRVAEQRHVPVLVGLLSGTALGAKLTYVLPLGAALGTLIVAAGALSGKWKQRVGLTFGWCLTIGLAAAAVNLASMFKNGMLFSEPLFPFLGTAFGQEVWFSPDTVRRILLTLPLSLTFGEYWAQHGTLSAIVLGCIPLLLVYAPRGPGEGLSSLRRVSVAAVIGIAAWFAVLSSQLAPRYFLGPLLLLAIPAAWAGECAWNRGRKIVSATVVLFVLTVTALITFEVALTHARAALRYMNERARDGNVCWSQDPHCYISRMINLRLKPGDRLAFLSYYRYHLRSDIIQCSVPLAGLSNGINPESLPAAGVHYILVDRSSHSMVPIPPELVEVVYEDAGFVFYKVASPVGGSAPGATCTQTQPGRWVVVKRV